MTVTNSLATTGASKGKIVYGSYITSTSLTTTDPMNGVGVDIGGVNVRAIAAAYAITKGAVASTGVTMNLQGSLDGSTWFTLKNTSGANIATTSATIGAATTTSPVTGFVDTEVSGRKFFPYKAVRVQLDQSGATKGLTGTCQLIIVTHNNDDV